MIGGSRWVSGADRYNMVVDGRDHFASVCVLFRVVARYMYIDR